MKTRAIFGPPASDYPTNGMAISRFRAASFKTAEHHVVQNISKVDSRFSGIVQDYHSRKKSEYPLSVIPVQTGIQYFQDVAEHLDPGFHRGDDFLRGHQDYHYEGFPGSLKIQRPN